MVKWILDGIRNSSAEDIVGVYFGIPVLVFVLVGIL